MFAPYESHGDTRDTLKSLTERPVRREEDCFGTISRNPVPKAQIGRFTPKPSQTFFSFEVDTMPHCVHRVTPRHHGCLIRLKWSLVYSENEGQTSISMGDQLLPQGVLEWVLIQFESYRSLTQPRHHHNRPPCPLDRLEDRFIHRPPRTPPHGNRDREGRSGAVVRNRFRT
jgi:hypothetical protein